MEFKLEVGKCYQSVMPFSNGKDYQIITILGRKSDKKLKVIYEGDNSLSYTAEGHVIGYQVHMFDIQPRKVKALT